MRRRFDDYCFPHLLHIFPLHPIQKSGKMSRHSGMVQLIECVVWECVDPIHEPFEQKPGKPCNTGDSGTLFLGQIRRKNRFDHMFDHIQKNLCFYPCYDDMTKNRIPGCSSVDRTRGLGPRGREFEPLHSDQNPSEIIDFRGIFLSLITAAQNLSCLTLSIYTDDCLGLPPQRRCPHRQAAAGGIPCGSR